MQMIRLFTLSLALCCALPSALAAGPNWVAGAGMGLGGDRNIAMRLNATGTVLAVDSAARLMSVKGRRGNITFRLDPKVANVEQIRVGQRVNVDYVAGMVLTRRGSDEAREYAARAAARRSAPSASLAETYERPIVFVTEVVEVDKDELLVRMRGPAGEVVDYKVHDRSDLAGVRAGEEIVVSMNQAVAVGVTPATR